MLTCLACQPTINFLGHLYTVFQSSHSVFSLYQKCTRGLTFLHTFLDIVFSGFVDNSHVNECEGCLHTCRGILYRTKIKDVYLEEGRASEPLAKNFVLQHSVFPGIALYGDCDKNLFS